MHADEIETDVALTRRLLEGQFPQWAELPIEPVVSALAYYWDTNAGMIRQASHALRQVLDDRPQAPRHPG